MMRNPSVPVVMRRLLLPIIVISVFAGLSFAPQTSSQELPPNINPTVPSFDLARSIYTSTEFVEAVAVGNIDEAGDHDFVTVSADGTVRLFLNDPSADGGFRKMAPFALLPENDTDRRATSVALAQLDGPNGLPQLVVGIAGGTNYILFLERLGEQGDLRVASNPVAFGPSGTTTSLAVENIDKAGGQDIVVGYRGRANTIFFNFDAAQRTFSTGNTKVLPLPVDHTSNATSSLDLADFTGDGNPEIVVGVGGEAKNFVLVAPDNPITDNWTPMTIDASDTGDGAFATTSIAVGWSGTASIIVVGNEPAPGSTGELLVYKVSYDTALKNLSFIRQDTEDINTGVDGLVVTDMNGDGRDDIVAVASEQEPRTLFGRATAIDNDLFLPPRSAFANGSQRELGYVDLAVGKLNDDLSPDLVAVGPAGIDVLPAARTRSAATYALPRLACGPENAPALTTRSVAVGDLDGNGVADIVQGNFEQQSCIHLLSDETTTLAFGEPTDKTVDLATGQLDSSPRLEFVAARDGGESRAYRLNTGRNGVDELSVLHTVVKDGKSVPDPTIVNVAIGATSVVAVRSDGSAARFTADGNVYRPATEFGVSNASDLAVEEIVGDTGLEVAIARRDQQVGLFAINATAPITTVSLAPGLSPKLAVAPRLTNVAPLVLVGGSIRPLTALVVNSADDITQIAYPQPNGGLAGVTAIATGDLDADGFLDVVVIGEQAAGVYYFDPAGYSANPPQPYRRVEYPRLAGASSVALGDVTGDGFTDIVAGFDGDGVRIFSNRRGLLAGPIRQGEATVDSVRIAVTGDMDGDSDLDLVTGNYGGIQIHINTSGAGNKREFEADLDQPALSFLSPSMATALALADMNGDNRLDVVIGYSSGLGQIWLNCPADGNPYSNGKCPADASTPPQLLPGATFGPGEPDTTNKITSLAVADLDGKDSPDVVVGIERGPGRVYLGPVNYATQPLVEGTPLPVQNITSLAVAEVSSDNAPDLIAGTTAGLFVAYGQSGAGFGPPLSLTTAPCSRYTGSTHVTRIAIGDVNRGTIADVVAGFDDGAVHAFLLVSGNCRGATGERGNLPVAPAYDATGITLEPGVTFDEASLKVGGPSTLHVADMDGDGWMDIIGAGTRQRVQITDEDNDGEANEVIVRSVPFQAVFLQDRENVAYANEFPNCNYASPALVRCFGDREKQPREVVPADMDGDGDLDLVALFDQEHSFDREPTIMLLFNDGAGAIISPGSAASQSEYPNPRIAVADFDGDRRNDILLADAGGRGGVFGPSLSVSFTTVQEAGDLAVGDLNRDGLPDLVIADLEGEVRVHLNRSGSFDDKPGTELDGAPLAWLGAAGRARYQPRVAIGRFDGDETLDIVVSHAGGQTLVFFNRGNGTFYAGPLPVNNGDIDCTSLVRDGYPVACVGGPTDPTTDVAAADIDGDGATDVVAVYRDQPGGEFRPGMIYLNTTGRGDFATAGEHCDPPSVRIRCFGDELGTALSVVTGDLNRDGIVDLVVAGEAGPKRVYFGASTGNYVAERSIDCFAPPENVGCFGRDTDQTRLIELADVDADSDLDLLVSNLGQQHVIFLNDGEGEFSARRLVGTTASGGYGLASGDLNGDGIADFVADAPSTSDDAVKIYYSVPTGTQGGINGMPKVRVDPPRCSGGTPCVIDGRTITINYTLRDPESDPVARVRGFYSLDGGGSWREAMPATPITATLETSPDGISHSFEWDLLKSQFFGQSDQVVFRIEAYPAPHKRLFGPYLRGFVTGQTSPFSASGVRIRVLESPSAAAEPQQLRPTPCTPLSTEACHRLYLPLGGNRLAQLSRPRLLESNQGAWVFIIPPDSIEQAEPLTSTTGLRLQTNASGYLQGQPQGIIAGASLIVLKPVQEAANGKFTVYQTNARPANDRFATFHKVTFEAGMEQQITVSPQHPLVLLNLTVSLEWEAADDDEYLRRLEADLKRTSALLYDWTNGQVALGRVRVLDNKAEWATADIRIYASNLFRPNAALGGMAQELAADASSRGAAVADGQIRIGATWSRYGDAGGSVGEDWPRALAHELGHYAFGLYDNYLGEDEQGFLTQIDDSDEKEGCRGVMSNPYVEGQESEFRTRDDWERKCAKTLANIALKRADWEQIINVIPALQQEPVPYTQQLAGPNRLLLDVTDVQFVPDTQERELLPAPIFYVEYREPVLRSLSQGARAYLFKRAGNAIVDVRDLGEPVAGQLLARGATRDDLLCVYDLKRSQPAYGCHELSTGESRMPIREVADWPPEVIVTPIDPNTSAIAATVTLPRPLGVGELLMAQHFPTEGQGSEVKTLGGGPLVFSGDFSSAAGEQRRALGGQLRVWVQVGDKVVREVLASYGLGGSPAKLTTATAEAPVLSPDGGVIVYGRKQNFDPGQYYLFQGVTRPPEPPSWATPVGESYRLTASSSQAPSLSNAAISFNYLGRNIPPGEEGGIRIYYYPEGPCSRPVRGTCWQELTPTRVNTTLNVASAPMRGPGIYALMSSIPINLQLEGWNSFAYPSRVTLKVEEALRSIDGLYDAVAYVDGDGPWQIFNPTSPDTSTLKELVPGRGYLIFMKQPRTTLLLRGSPRTGEQSAAAQILPVLPETNAIFHGQVLATPDFMPVPGLQVTARVGTMVCGFGTTVATGEGISYVLLVRTEGSQWRGCGAPGRDVSVSVEGSPLVATIAWERPGLLHADLTGRGEEAP